MIGPLKLPKLKKIPHNKFPVAKRFFGTRSVIKLIPRENVEPTAIPEKRKHINRPIKECSRKLATVKLKNPKNRTVINTFLRP